MSNCMLDKYEELDQHEIALRLFLPYFITHMIYPALPIAQQKGWVLGKLHIEWGELLTKTLRLRVLGPRDHLKSFFFAVCYSIQQMWTRPGIYVMLISSTDTLAMTKLDAIKKIIETVPELRHLSEGAKVWGKQRIELSNGSVMYVQGCLTKLRGEHPHLLILDDVIDSKVVYSKTLNDRSQEWFYAEVLPMAEKETQIVVDGTVQREDDLYHSFDPAAWELKTYSAIVNEETKETLFPEMWDWDTLMTRKGEIVYKHGDRFWRKEYLNDPKALVGQIFKETWLRFYGEKPKDCSIFVGMDPSTGQTIEGDYTAIVTVGINPENCYYVLDVQRGRWTLPDRLNVLERVCRIWNPMLVGIEEVAFSADTVQQAIDTFRWPVLGIKCSRSNKMMRAEALSIFFKNEKILFPCMGYDDNGVPILDQRFKDLRDELIGFPGSFDDQMDALHIATTLAAKEGWKPVSSSQPTRWMQGLQAGDMRSKTYFSERKF